MKIISERGIQGLCKGCDFYECCPKSDGIQFLTENKGLQHCWEDDCIFKISKDHPILELEDKGE